MWRMEKKWKLLECDYMGLRVSRVAYRLAYLWLARNEGMDPYLNLPKPVLLQVPYKFFTRDFSRTLRTTRLR